MRKRILSLLCLLVLCFAVCGPFRVCAATPLDPDAKASLTLHYQKDGAVFSDLQIRIHRIAEAYADGSFGLIAPFSDYPVSIYDITAQEQWKTVTTTLCACIVADNLPPDRQIRTDSQGIAHFSDLETGLYLVRQVVAQNATGTYTFNDFLVYLPTPQPDGSYNYDITANPKCGNFIPTTQYTVTKLWQDGRNQSARPAEVTVDIFKDGALKQTQVLNSENNWTYTWAVSGEDTGIWTVAERSVTDPYRVTVQQNGSTFTIINTCQTQPEAPPTGDSFAPLPWILAMYLSGVVLLILSLCRRRQQ